MASSKTIGPMIGGAVQKAMSTWIGHTKMAQAQRAAIDQARGATTSGYDESAGYYLPYYEAGMQDYNALRSGVNSGAYDVPYQQYNFRSAESYGQAPGTYQDKGFNFQADPGYQFRQSEGQRAIEQSAAARGSQLSGATLKALAQYGQNMASQEYGQAYGRYAQDRAFGAGQSAEAYDRFASERAFGASRENLQYQDYLQQYQTSAAIAENRYNRQLGLANVGSQAASNLANIAQLRGNALAEYAIQQGNVTANKWLGYAQASYNLGQDAIDIAGGTSGSGGGDSGGGGSMVGFNFGSLFGGGDSAEMDGAGADAAASGGGQ
jgi:hypothetical protein